VAGEEDCVVALAKNTAQIVLVVKHGNAVYAARHEGERGEQVRPRGDRNEWIFLRLV